MSFKELPLMSEKKSVNLFYHCILSKAHLASVKPTKVKDFIKKIY
jgi:hypothetical protein